MEKLGFWHEDAVEADNIIKQANAIELGRIMTRDIGGSDPERMSAENVLKYVRQALGSTEIKVISINKKMANIVSVTIFFSEKIDVVEGQDEFVKSYPCFAAVRIF